MILARNQFDQRKYFHPKSKVNFYQVVILSYLRYLSLLFAPSVGNSFWPFSRPSVQTSPPGSTVNYFLSPIWENFHLNLTLSDSQIPSPPLQQLLQSFPRLPFLPPLPFLLSVDSKSTTSSSQTPPLSSVWLSANLSRTLSGDRGSWSRRQMTTWILHFTPGALTGSCQGIKTTS